MITDADLVRAARDGDEDALGTLLRRHQDSVYGYLLRMLRHTHDAEEAAQTTFAIAIRALPRYREQGRFKAWLFKIAHREALRILRHSKRLSSLDEQADDATLPEQLVDPLPRPDEAADASDTNRRLEIALGDLPAAEREVVLLRMKEELTFREIAALTGCPLGTALGRMRNALRRLRETLKDIR